MAISCGCDYDSGICAVHVREVTCRTQKKCDACGTAINILELTYMHSMFDFDTTETAAPVFLCETCGDLAETLLEHGYCYDLGESIRDQWLDYLHDTAPTNIALKEKPCK